MNNIIYNPLEDYEKKLCALHLKNVSDFLESLVKRSGVNINENRAAVKKYNELKENLKKLSTKRNWLRFLRVIMCITLILIPLVIWWLTPKIQNLKKEIDEADQKADELFELAQKQMAPLNALFGDRDCLKLIETTIPLLSFENCFTSKQELDMITNFDFSGVDNNEQSTLDVLHGKYNENPFLFENKTIHTMGTETYHGYKTIYWTERYRDSDGKMQTRSRSQTLHATVVKPKPFYTTQVVLNYGSQGAPDLSFTRDATHLEQKSEKAIERYVKRGEKKLKRLTDKALRENDDFMSMSNSEFEVLFDALDRTDEVQYRTLFTPLAQTNMVDLLLSKTTYGDDFNFFKSKRMNKIISKHSQGRAMILAANEYYSYSFDIIKQNFEGKNAEFFKAVYFDFAPLWAIPAYQERPVHSLKPIPDYSRLYSQKECEALANCMNKSVVVHPKTKTQAILKSDYITTKDKVETTKITAYSYDIIPQVTAVPMLGGDGKMHSVPVPWDDYIPLESENAFYVAERGSAIGKNVLAYRNGLCIFK